MKRNTNVAYVRVWSPMMVYNVETVSFGSITFAQNYHPTSCTCKKNLKESTHVKLAQTWTHFLQKISRNDD